MEFVIGILDDLLDSWASEDMGAWMSPKNLFQIDHYYTLGGVR